MEDNKVSVEVQTPVGEQQFAEVIGMIRTTRQNVIRIANTALIELYWNVGKYLSQKIASSEWGDGVVRQLADYISKTNPDLKGFSDKNLWRMKQFYETYAEDAEKLSALLRQISWTNNLTILSRCKSASEYTFYLQACIKERLSTRQLDRQIADFFEVTERTIESCLEKHGKELERNVYEALRGKHLTDIKLVLQDAFGTEVDFGTKQQCSAYSISEHS